MLAYKKSLIIGFGAFLLILLGAMTCPIPNSSLIPLSEAKDFDEITVWEVYEKLGKIKLHKVDSSIEGISAEKGYELVHKGVTTAPNGKKTKRQSKYFVCTACHNTVKEFDDLTENSPEKRLEYAIKNNIPFLQGTTFYGMVNRLSFYNDEYQKKYASVPGIKESQRDIRAAIQVCATACSQGRAFEPWELESVLAYFWTLEYKLGDLGLSSEEKTKIKFSLENDQSSARAVKLIEAKFNTVSPAHFVDAEKYEPLQPVELRDKARIENGKNVYEKSCLHCHEKKKFSFYALDQSLVTFKHLDAALRHEKKHSVLKLVRYGTAPRKGRKAYMPQYTIEKMSEQQLKDLRLYIQAMAKGKNLE